MKHEWRKHEKEIRMNHIVYLDAKSKELENLLDGKKSMIIRGAAGRKVPYGKVNVGDIFYFINNNAEGEIKAKGVVSSVFNSDKMTKDESSTLVKKHQSQLNLTARQFQKWAGKRYLVLIEIKNIEKIQHFQFNRDIFKNMMDDWLPVENIETVKK